MTENRPKPTPSEIAIIAASLRRSETDDLDLLTRTAIQLWELSETKLAQLARFEKEVSPKWREWYAVDQNPQRRSEWLSGQKLVTLSLREQTTDRIRRGEIEVKELGAQGPPEKHSFNLNAVADKVLPQKNTTERYKTALEYLEGELAEISTPSEFRQWLEDTKGQRTSDKAAWWIWSEILIRWQKKTGRFRKTDRWKENLRKRRLESQPSKEF